MVTRSGLRALTLPLISPSKKLTPRRFGPFPIIKKVGQSAYHLQLPPTWKIHPVFNESLLSPYTPPHFPIQQSPPPPPPEIIDGSEEFEVEEILDSRFYRNQLQYLVKWKGYPSEDNTWEPERNLKRAKEEIAAFHNAYPSAPRRISASLRFIPTSTHPKGSCSPPWWLGKLPGKESRGAILEKGVMLENVTR